MWTISLPWTEFVVRAVVVYAFILVLMRFGKRQVGQLAPFDLTLLLILSNAVQNSMNGGDNSITGGLILAGTLMGVNSLVGWLAFRFKPVEACMEGRPVILIHDGVIDRRALAEVSMSNHELLAALRQQGHVGPGRVRFAVLETTGKVSVIANDPEANRESRPDDLPVR